MNLPRFIARRTATDQSTPQNAMVHIATVAVAVSIAVVIISIAVMQGFRTEITKLVSGSVADISVMDFRSMRQPESFPITDSEELRNLITSNSNIDKVERYAMRGAILRTKSGSRGIAMKGIDSTANLSHFDQRLIEGRTPRLEESRHKEIAIAESISKSLNISTNDRIEIILLEQGAPRREIFKVCGIYRSALGEAGAKVVLTDIRNVQKLNGWDNSQITGYALLTTHPELAPETSDTINARLLHEYEGEESVAAISSQESHADIFSWLETHDVNTLVILSIMLIVAIFNMATALLILVLERTRMIGTLKAMGMTNGEIRKIFTHRATRVMWRGIVAGNIVAIALLLAQQHLHLIKLDETGYFLNEVPVSLDTWWIVGVNLLFMGIIAIVMHTATRVVQHIKVADAIKFQ